MFMARSFQDHLVTTTGDTIAEVWEDLQFSFDLTDAEFDDMEWFKIEPITVKLKTEFVIE